MRQLGVFRNMNTSRTRLARLGSALLLLVAICAAAPGQDSPVTGSLQPRPASSPGQHEASAEDLQSIRKLIDSGHPADALQRISVLRSTASQSSSQAGDQPGLGRLEGLAQYALGDLKAADTAFAEALTLDHADVESSQMRGLILFRLGRPADAIPLLEAAAAKGSLGKADPNYILALCYLDTRRYDDARHAFAAQFGFPPDSAAAYLATARMLLRREFLPVAKTFAEKAIEIEPSLPLAHELLGEIALAGNHLDDAIAEFQQEKARNPLEPSLYDRLGDAYTRAARYDDAQRTLQAALLLEPNATGPYILLGKTMLKKGDAVAAATYLERADQLDPANYITHSLLGQAYRAMGRSDEASRQIATAQKLQAESQPTLESVH
jgi:tetratricopeptide (TPR) repeat protein